MQGHVVGPDSEAGVVVDVRQRPLHQRARAAQVPRGVPRADLQDRHVRLAGHALVAAHEGVQALGRDEALPLVVGVDARQGGCADFVHHFVVVDAQHGDVLRHLEAALAAHLDHGERAVVERHEKRRGFLQAFKPVAQLGEVVMAERGLRVERTVDVPFR